jgi:hypothetical protein
VSVTAAAALRTFAFGDLAAGLWGTGWFGAPNFVTLGAGADATPFAAALEGAADSDEWRLVGEAAELTLAATGPAVTAAARDAGIEGFEQLCAVEGRFLAQDAEHEVACLGIRGARGGDFELGRYDSLRRVSVWFESGDGLALLALRPRGSRGHDSDVITAAVLDPEGGSQVADPRLSTTYTTAGQPYRAGLELWLPEDEESEHEQFPRRAAGEAVGAGSRSVVDGLGVEAELLRWRSRGLEGAGVYLLASRR